MEAILEIGDLVGPEVAVLKSWETGQTLLQLIDFVVAQVQFLQRVEAFEVLDRWNLVVLNV